MAEMPQIRFTIRTVWEYKTLDFHESFISDAFLNEQGRHGWELCAIRGAQFVFKRQIA